MKSKVSLETGVFIQPFFSVQNDVPLVVACGRVPDIVGGVDIGGLLFRLETWAAGSGYVGPGAAQDEQWVTQVFNALQSNWPKPRDAYIDLY